MQHKNETAARSARTTVCGTAVHASDTSSQNLPFGETLTGGGGHSSRGVYTSKASVAEPTLARLVLSAQNASFPKGATSQQRARRAVAVEPSFTHRILRVFLIILLVAGLLPVLPNFSEPESAFAADADNATLVITHQPIGGTFALGGELRLFVQASCGTNLLKYEWYRSSDASVSAGDTLVSGQTSSVLSGVKIDSASGFTAGTTYYYYAKVKTADNKQTATSAPAAVKVVNKGTIGSSLGNGDFETTGGSPSFGNWYYRNLPFWKTTQSGTAENQNWDGVIELGNAAAYGVPSAGHGERMAELCAAFSSSLYQEVATVPGRIYEWSLDFVARNVQKETVAVVIGPALEGVWSGTGASQTFPYGINATGYFNKVVDKLVTDKGLGGVANLTQFVGQDLSTVYNGSTYYVRIVNTKTVKQWATHSGAYTVPEGQGVSVFGFVSVDTNAPGSGNILDNITFTQGTGAAISSDVDYAGGGVISTQVDNIDYRYGILETRGSTAFAAQGVNVTLANTPLSADASGWYSPGAQGKLTFSNLTPGKTYRVVAIPQGAINKDLGANLTPATVLDESYYQQVTVKPVADSSQGAGGNIQATAQATPDGKANIIIKPARDDVEYALLATSSNGTVPDPNSPHIPAGESDGWVSAVSGSGVLTFEKLDRATSYAVLARPKGYDEIDYATQVSAKSFIVVKTPSAAFRDVHPSDGSVVREAATPSTITVTNKGSQTQKYLIYDAITGAATDGQWHEIQIGKSFAWTTGVDETRAYQVVTAEVGTAGGAPGSAPSPGLLSYGQAPKPIINYANETVGDTDGKVPAGAEYRIQTVDGKNWLVGNATTWEAGTGGSQLSLSEYLDNSLTGAGGLTFTYRVRPVVQPSITIEEAVTIPARPAMPSMSAAGYTFEYTKEGIIPGTSAAGNIEARTSDDAVWVSGAKDKPVLLSGLGWTGATKNVQVRMAATSAAFASKSNNTAAIPARPSAPDINVVVDGSNSNVYHFTQGSSGTTLADCEYRLSGSTAAWAPCTGSSLTKGKTYEARKIATTTEFASSTVQRSALGMQLSVTSGSLADVIYGYKEIPSAKLTITNPSTVSAASIFAASDTAHTTITMTAKPSGYTDTAFTVTGLAETLATGGTSSNWTVKAKSGLPAGTYTANVVLSFKNATDLSDTSIYTATATVTLVVAKATPEAPTAFKIESVTDTTATLSAYKNDPHALTLEYSTAPSTGYGDNATLTGLSPATRYNFYVRSKANDNHNASKTARIAASTAWSAPEAGEVTFNYVAETLAFTPEFEVEDSSSNALATGASVTSLIGQPLRIRHKETPATSQTTPETYIPASTWTSTTVPSRPNLSAVANFTPATDSNTNDGSITINGVPSFEYRKKGTTSWTPVTGSTMTGIPAAVYEARTPASTVAFASSVIEANLEAKNVYITFNLNGGEGSAPNTQYKPKDSQADKPADPVRTGYTFQGWFTSPDGGATLGSTAYDFATTVTTDITLYAKWKVNTHSLTFDPAGGTWQSGSAANNPTAAFTRNVDFGTTVSLPGGTALPKQPGEIDRVGYKFVGWYTGSKNSSGTITYDPTPWPVTTMPDKALTLYAKWERPAISAEVPLNVTVSVKADGTVDTPTALDPDNIGAGYGITSKTDAALKVDSIVCELDAQATSVFPKGKEGLTLTLNNQPLSIGAVGTPATVKPTTGFAIPKSDTINPVGLPLSLSLKLASYTPVTYVKDDVATGFVKLTYTLAFDDSAPTTTRSVLTAEESLTPPAPEEN